MKPQRELVLVTVRESVHHELCGVDEPLGLGVEVGELGLIYQ